MTGGPVVERVWVERASSRVRGVFRIAYSAEASVTHLLVKVELSDGSLGVGEAAPSPRVTWENTASVEAYVASLAEGLRGLRLPEQLNKALHLVHRGAPGFSAARAGLEAALLDAASKALGAGEGLLLGAGPTGGGLLTDYTVSIPDETVLDELRAGRWGRAVEAFLEAVEYIVGRRREPPAEAPIPLPPLQGFHAVKLKLGTGSPWLDLELARLVGEVLEESRVLVRVDANQAWTPKTAVRVIGRLERIFGDLLELVEQPVPAMGPEPLRRVTEAVEVPVAADEAARSLEEIASIASKRAADIINIKLAKIGGPLQAVRGAAVAAAHGLEVMWGCMVESGYGIRHAALAALTTGFTRIVDLDSPLFLVDPPGLGEAVSYQATDRGVELLAKG